MNRSAFKAILDEIANFSEWLHGLDKTASTVIAEFGTSLTKALQGHVSNLDARLTRMLHVAPEVDRSLQQLQPSSDAAARSVRNVETLSVAAVDHVAHSVSGLADSLAPAKSQLDRVASTQATIVRTSAEAAPPEIRPGRNRALLLVGIAAAAGMLLTWSLLRVAG